MLSDICEIRQQGHVSSAGENAEAVKRDAGSGVSLAQAAMTYLS